MYVTLLLHCRSRRCRGCGNTVGVTDIDLCADRISCVYDHPSVSVETSGYVRDHNRFVDKLVSVRLGSAVYAVRSLDQSLYHSAVSGVEVEVHTADILPAGHHFTCLVEVVGLAVYGLQACHHASVSRVKVVAVCHIADKAVLLGSRIGIKVEGTVADLDHAGLHDTVFVKVVVCVFDVLITCHHMAVYRGEVVAVRDITEPASYHSAVSRIIVVSQAVYRLPVGQHAAFRAEQVVLVVDVDAALYKVSVRGEEVMSARFIVVPAGYHTAAVVSVIEVLVVGNGDPAALNLSHLIEIVAVRSHLILSYKGMTVGGEIVGACLIRKPVGVHMAKFVHVVAGAVKVHPAELDAVIVIEVGKAVALRETDRNDQVVIVFVHVVDIHIARDAGDGTLVGSLPDGMSRDGAGAGVLGDPDIVAQGGCHMSAVKVRAGVDDGVVACRRDHIAESVAHGGNGIGIKPFLHTVFDVVGYGEVDVVTLDPLQDQIGFVYGAFHAGGVGIDVNAGSDACRLGACHVGGEGGVNAAFGAADLDKGIGNAGRGNRSPVDGALILGYVDSQCCRIGNRGGRQREGCDEHQRQDCFRETK